jgi:hypothetical protein
MRSSHRFIGSAVLAAAIVGCSSSSHPATTTDAAASAGEEASVPCIASDAGLLAAYAPPSGTNDAGFDPGNAWTCEKAACAAKVTACSNDCSCNVATLGGLACAAGIATYAEEVDCFNTAFAAVLQGTADSPLDMAATCIMENLESCSGIAPDAGPDAEATETGATEAGAVTDAGATEAAVPSDATAGDAADGGVEQ